MPITAIKIKITTNPIPCTVPCNLRVDVAWQNTDISTLSFIPAIIVGITKYSNPISSLPAGAVGLYVFYVTMFAVGTFIVCPDPN